MSRYDVSRQMNIYEDDFKKQYTNFGFKIQFGAPGVETLYDLRQGTCSSARFFRPRFIRAKFADKRTLEYPVPFEASVKAYAVILKSLGAICMTYFGETWSVLQGKNFSGFAYKTERYAALAPSKKFEVGTFQYESNTGFEDFADIRLGYRIVKNDESNLVNCQTRGLLNMQEGSLCTTGDIISPRSLIIKAKSLDGDGHIGSVIRLVKQSETAGMLTVAAEIAGCAFCLGYAGEIIRGLENFLD